MASSAFAANLRVLIETRGMNIKTFSADIGMSAATISRYISQKREPSESTILRIAQYFGVSTDWLLGNGTDLFDAMPKDLQEVVSLYSLASEGDRRVINAVLNKYKRYDVKRNGLDGVSMPSKD